MILDWIHKPRFWKNLTLFILLLIVFSACEMFNYSSSEFNETFSAGKNFSGGNYTVPWPNDVYCSRYKTRFGANIPLTYLASYPRSGNTWLRYLIEGSTGIFTGSIYNDGRLQDKFLGEAEEWNSGRTIVAKIHPQILQSSPLRSLAKTPVVLILRNPYKSILSYWDFIYAGRIGRRDEAFQFIANRSSLLSEDFRNHVKRQIRTWEKCAQTFLSMTKNLHVVFYENLLANTVHELNKLLKFLKIAPDVRRMKCIQKYHDGKAKRKSKTKIEPYSLSEQIHLTNAIANVVGLLTLRRIEVPDEYKKILSRRTYLMGNN